MRQDESASEANLPVQPTSHAHDANVAVKNSGRQAKNNAVYNAVYNDIREQDRRHWIGTLRIEQRKKDSR
jgi:hypothetical protein